MASKSEKKQSKCSSSSPTKSTENGSDFSSNVCGVLKTIEMILNCEREVKVESVRRHILLYLTTVVQ